MYRSTYRATIGSAHPQQPVADGHDNCASVLCAGAQQCASPPPQDPPLLVQPSYYGGPTPNAF